MALQAPTLFSMTRNAVDGQLADVNGRTQENVDLLVRWVLRDGPNPTDNVIHFEDIDPPGSVQVIDGRPAWTGVDVGGGHGSVGPFYLTYESKFGG